MEKYIIFEGIIEKEAANKLAAAILNCRQLGHTAITIFFSSLGGSIYEGFILATLIRNFNIPITIHATNHIDSIGNVIYLAGKQRTAESYAKFYMHGASAGGNFDERGLKDQLSSIKTNNSRIAHFISENSNLLLKKVQAMMRVGTTISAQQALLYGMVQEISHKEVPPGTVAEEIIYIN